jgi:ABC-type lipoprotein export system ATPase subunit
MTTIPLLDIRNLTVEFATRRGTVRAVQHIDISVAKGETLAIVGESGSGKSVTSYAVMRILDRTGRIAGGSVTFSGIDVRKAGEREMRNLRGREISMIFQNPRAALNPIHKVGYQIEDVLRQHAQAGSNDKTEKVIAILEQVHIARPRERYHAYPFELSGGMCQRVVIALALACRPQVLRARHRPRCHHAEDRNGPDRAADTRTRNVHHPYHPRSRPCRRLLRLRRGDGERQRGGNSRRGDHLRGAVARLYEEADAGYAASRRDAGPIFCPTARPRAGHCLP